MNSLKTISSSDLIINLENLCGSERKVGIEILHHLKEVESRSLHLERGFGSLHEFCVVVLKYTDGAAQRRIHAMRLLRALPEIESDLLSGELNLTNASLIQRVLPTQTTSHDQKRKWVSAVKGKSVRDAETLLRAEHPAARVLTERTRVLAEHERKLSPKKRGSDKSKGPDEIRNPENLCGAFNSEEMADTMEKKEVPGRSTSVQKLRSENPRAIRSEDRRRVFIRAQNQCEHVDPQTKRRCTSRFALQVDHHRPVAQNGGSEFENLQILCRAHNLQKGAG